MNDLLELAVAAHGGADRWNAVRRIHLHLSVTGALFRIKGLPDGMTDMLMSVDAREQAVKIAPYSRSDLRGGYLPNRVWIEDRKGAVVEELEDPRSSFAGHVRETQWNQLQRLYFISYAFWNYLAIPFLLARPGFIATELSRHQEGSDSWRRLEVAFPADVATHCRTQVFYFSDDGLLRRHDYVTDVAVEQLIATTFVLPFWSLVTNPPNARSPGALSPPPSAMMKAEFGLVGASNLTASPA